MLTASAADNETIRHKQQAQEKARAIAGELVAAVLDVQLRQLEENGLKSLPIYRDIASMKLHIDGLMKDDMEAIVQLLIEAQEGTPDQRLARFNAARAKIREVVVQLMAERQKLYRRMQVARLSAEVKQLISLETKAHETTRSLPEHRAEERERLALATIEDQADVNKLYYQLVAALADVSTWGGQAAAGASDGLRILKAAQVEPELKRAGEALGKADFSAAAAGQQAVIKGLAALLEKLEETQGLMAGDRQAALRLVRELLSRQQALRERTKQTELTERTAEPLIEQQTSLQKELGKLATVLAKFPPTEPLIEQAKAASFEATANLFEEKRLPAVDEQGRVIGNLAQIEKVLEQGLDLTQASKSANELAAEMARLEELKGELQVAAREQAAATEAASKTPETAQRHESDVAESLIRTDQLGDFAGAIHARLGDAKEKVADGQRAMENRGLEAAEARQDAADQALVAIKQAQAEVESQLADTRRRQKAVEVGELARAAEALERASAAEREIARQANEAAQTNGLDGEKAAALAFEHSEVAEVAEKIAAGVKTTASAASEMLDRTEPTIAEESRHLGAAVEQAGEANKPATASASRLAEELSRQLADAAAALRNEQGRAATELEKIAGEQLAQAETARQAVEKAGESAKTGAAEAIAKLDQAKRNLSEALVEQARAEGKPQEALAKTLAGQIADLVRLQHDADQAAHDLARGKSNNPIDAAAQQQEVADKSDELARRSPAEISKPLGQVAKAAAEAAKETLGGSSAKAETARKLARGALAKATQAAGQQAQQASQAQPGQLDAAAQAKVGEKANQAQQSAQQAANSDGQSAQQAVDSLGRAKDRAAFAAQQLLAGNADDARASQREVGHVLDNAAAKLDEALRELAQKQAGEMAQQARQTSRLIDQAAQIDPGAAAALAQAQQAAERGAQASREPVAAATAQQQAQQKLDQAAANLAARQQQLRRDRDLALALAQLAKDQQAAREQIAQAARQLQQPSSPASAQQLAAAQALQQAQQQFAAAQTATGEGAAEVSGQQEVANQPIRDGLEIASRLNQPAEAALPGEAGDRGQGTGDKGQETGDKGQGKADPESGANPKSQIPNQKSASQLGTGLVPASPQITAKQIAGPQASASAAAAMAAALKAQGKGESGPKGESETPKEGEASSAAKKGGAAKGGKTADNKRPDKGDLETADPPDADSRGKLGREGPEATGWALGRLEGEPWFAKLPPRLRAAILEKSRGSASGGYGAGKVPRGYEERLRRYFESMD